MGTDRLILKVRHRREGAVKNWGGLGGYHPLPLFCSLGPPDRTIGLLKRRGKAPWVNDGIFTFNWIN